mmetsp:Transcript_4265/g.15625  ORF Transcript_4265/g.15625 Transcript_4265/m.15625 type:complete len:208 (-) Transcript_4265:231-854(-)
MPVLIEAFAPSASKSSFTSIDVSLVDRLIALCRTSSLLVVESYTSIPSTVSIAARKPRAKALNVDSTMWCALSPRSFTKRKLTPDSSASARQNTSVCAVGYVPMCDRPAVPGRPYGAKENVSNPCPPYNSTSHVAYASSNGLANRARAFVPAPAPALNIAFIAFPSARPLASNTSAPCGVPASAHSAHAAPSRVTRTDTPSCACAVS